MAFENQLQDPVVRAVFSEPGCQSIDVRNAATAARNIEGALVAIQTRPEGNRAVVVRRDGAGFQVHAGLGFHWKTLPAEDFEVIGDYAAAEAAALVLYKKEKEEG